MGHSPPSITPFILFNGLASLAEGRSGDPDKSDDFPRTPCIRESLEKAYLTYHAARAYPENPVWLPQQTMGSPFLPFLAAVDHNRLANRLLQGAAACRRCGRSQLPHLL
jgi:hypothetical protein